MTQEDKELLLRDLCSRLPYNPLVEYEGEDYNVLGIAHGRLVLCKPLMSHTLNENPRIEEIKPYLFPLSSMTEEQKEELNRVTNGKFNSYGTYIDNCKPRNWNEWGTTEYNWIRHHDVDLLNTWLDKNYFDHRGLIEKGLAIKASEGMYNQNL